MLVLRYKESKDFAPYRLRVDAVYVRGRSLNQGGTADYFVPSLTDIFFCLSSGGFFIFKKYLNNRKSEINNT
jgi:hypothetical protein